MENNLAVYGSHLPLDCHPEIGNNAILAQKLELQPITSFLPYEGLNIGLITQNSYSRKELINRLNSLFPKGINSMEFGSDFPSKIAILTGSGQSAVDKILESGADTLITGELKQNHFNIAQELKLNLYTCGHYATETFGVEALGKELAAKFDLPFQFIETACPL
jgi:dinuclear metal center YbgI/SA1388 family protein